MVGISNLEFLETINETAFTSVGLNLLVFSLFNKLVCRVALEATFVDLVFRFDELHNREFSLSRRTHRVIWGP